MKIEDKGIGHRRENVERLSRSIFMETDTSCIWKADRAHGKEKRKEIPP